ncbi:MAG: hypothetical protein ACWA6X_02530 [Bauldia sp.]|jgi:hypothetical protein
MSSRNASGYDDWQPAEATWDDGTFYTGVADVVPRRSLLRRVWTGRPMIYVLAAGLVAVTALVVVTRPDAEPAAAAAPAVAAAPPAPITYDAGPVVEAELDKP